MEVFKKYKAIWLFLLRFFGVYGLGVWGYNTYLSYFTTEIDQITRWVTLQVAALFSLTLPEIKPVFSVVSPIAEIHYFDSTLVLLIEGCNAVSVMILFLAFIVAFSGPLSRYLWFAPLGIIMLYIANIFRIYLIGMIVLYLPNYVDMAHDFVFPGVIYGTTFLLWVVWVKYLANKN